MCIENLTTNKGYVHLLKLLRISQYPNSITKLNSVQNMSQISFLNLYIK